VPIDNQFDWSHEIVVIRGVTTSLKVAHVRLCHSRMFFIRAYPRETQEMVFDAHDRAFAFFTRAPLSVPQGPNQCWALDFVSDG
jgi:transposase